MANYVGYTSDYKANMRELFQLLLNREKNVVEVHKLFGIMFNVIWYSRQLDKATDDTQVKQIQDSLDDAKRDLCNILKAWCLSERDKRLIYLLILSSV